MLIGMKEVRKMKWCAKGARDFCLRYGIDWKEFRTVGVTCERLLETGDARATEIVKAAKNGR
jgi:hypothetical protein